jgi:hypothetical protein
MLLIRMPDSGERRQRERRRRQRALLYLVPCPIILTAVFIAPNWWLRTAAIVVEAWWIWACRTDPRIRLRFAGGLAVELADQLSGAHAAEPPVAACAVDGERVTADHGLTAHRAHFH